MSEPSNEDRRIELLRLLAENDQSIALGEDLLRDNPTPEQREVILKNLEGLRAHPAWAKRLLRRIEEGGEGIEDEADWWKDGPGG